MIRARHDALAAKIRLDQLSERRPRCVSHSRDGRLEPLLRKCPWTRVGRAAKVQEEEPSQEGARIYEYGRRPTRITKSAGRRPPCRSTSPVRQGDSFDLSSLGDRVLVRRRTSCVLHPHHNRRVHHDPSQGHVPGVLCDPRPAPLHEHGTVKWPRATFVVPKTEGLTTYVFGAGCQRCGVVLDP